MSAHRPVIVLGGGLTGLSAAAHLGSIDSLVLEREAEVGGLCRSFAEEGFTFDCTGHLLHLRDARIRALVEGLAPGVFETHERRALIHSKGVLTPYPFQANLHGLPQPVVKECVAGFVDALEARARDGEPDTARLSFRQWVEATFGRGIAAHFMLPYNAKLWRVDLEEVECGWVAWSIPRPTIREILDGAFGTTVRGLGYNPTFLYPRQGGIRVLPDALAARAGEVRTGAAVHSIDARAKSVRLANGERFTYDALVSTLPLDRLLAITSGLPGALPEAGRKLRAVRVLNITLAIDRPAVSDAHWIYFPEPEYSFYRIGFPSNLGAAMAPKGTSSLWAECSLLRDETYDEDAVVDRTVEDLKRSGILRGGDRVIHRRVGVLDPAYVIYDRFRAQNVPAILETLRGVGIHSAGRFGSWEYSSMEGAIKAGIDLAERLGPALDRAGAPRLRATG
ncbi:MAG TPA: FAD-dependent oxidoreductase [Patescibacteria group bacterium]|nr:FAD-dependent oxidoreductase [Patescibacteria group bacterium]